MATKRKKKSGRYPGAKKAHELDHDERVGKVAVNNSKVKVTVFDDGDIMIETVLPERRKPVVKKKRRVILVD